MRAAQEFHGLHAQWPGLPHDPRLQGGGVSAQAGRAAAGGQDQHPGASAGGQALTIRRAALAAANISVSIIPQPPVVRDVRGQQGRTQHGQGLQNIRWAGLLAKHPPLHQRCRPPISSSCWSWSDTHRRLATNTASRLRPAARLPPAAPLSWPAPAHRTTASTQAATEQTSGKTQRQKFNIGNCCVAYKRIAAPDCGSATASALHAKDARPRMMAGAAGGSCHPRRRDAGFSRGSPGACRGAGVNVL
jgi:hypothetical protein